VCRHVAGVLVLSAVDWTDYIATRWRCAGRRRGGDATVAAAVPRGYVSTASCFSYSVHTCACTLYTYAWHRGLTRILLFTLACAVVDEGSPNPPTGDTLVWEWIQAQDDRNWKNIQGLQEPLGISTFADLIDTPKAIFEETIRSVAGLATNAISMRIKTAYPQAFANGTLLPFCHRVPHTSTPIRHHPFGRVHCACSGATILCHPCSSSPAPFELVVC
jgi:hypothetical protein